MNNSHLTSHSSDCFVSLTSSLLLWSRLISHGIKTLLTVLSASIRFTVVNHRTTFSISSNRIDFVYHTHQSSPRRVTSRVHHIQLMARAGVLRWGDDDVMKSTCWWLIGWGVTRWRIHKSCKSLWIVQLINSSSSRVSSFYFCNRCNLNWHGGAKT